MIKERPASPQISPERFRPLMTQKTIQRGTKIYKMNDQTLTHWQFDCYWIKGICSKGIMAYDEDKKLHLLTNINNLFIYRGHV